MTMFSEDLLSERLRFWRKQQGFSIEKIAGAVATSVDEVRDWDAGITEPSPNLRYRLSEMMRFDAVEQLSLRKAFVTGLQSYVSLIDVGDTRLIAASNGLRQLWPELSSVVGQPFLQHMTPEARSLMQDKSFVGKIRRCEVVFASGASERAVDRRPVMLERHRWTATFSSYGTKVVGEIWYDPEPTMLKIGVHELLTFSEIPNG